MGWPTDYNSWIVRLKEWLNVIDLSDASFGYCLDAATLRLNRDLNSQWMEETYSHTVVDDTPIDIGTLIPDFNRMRLVTIRGMPPLYAKAINEFRLEQALNPEGGDPIMYCVNKMKLYIWPPAPVDSVIDIDYYVQVPELSDIVNSNVFSLKHPDALLYAALVEATPFIVEDERLPTWTTIYTNIREAINVTADRANKGSTPLKRELRVM